MNEKNENGDVVLGEGRHSANWTDESQDYTWFEEKAKMKKIGSDMVHL